MPARKLDVVVPPLPVLAHREIDRAVTVDVRRVDTAMVIEPGDSENESEDQDDSTDDAGQQEQLLDPVV